jgi:prevent-host-death family protein
MATKSSNKKIRLHKTILGKSEAREQFLPLIKSLVEGAGPISIADYGKPVAVLLSKQEYDWMLAQIKNPLRGSIVLLGDLEEGSREIAKMFQKSIEKTAREL